MRHTILISTGTTSASVLRDFERKRQAEIERLERLNEEEIDPDRQLQIKYLQENIYSLPFDIDCTHIYNLNAPLSDPVPAWPVGTFHPVNLPGPSLVQQIETGYYRQGQFENLNPQALQALKSSSNASGGTPPNGWLAFATHQENLAQVIRRRFELILTQHREQVETANNGVQVILLASGFGGFASGTQESFARLILRIAREKQLEINLSRLLLIPGGTNTSKDSDNSRAVTAALLKEMTAISSGRHYHREKVFGSEDLETTTTRFVPCFLFSDTNHAPGTPKGLLVSDFAGMVSEYLWTVATTDLGPRLDASIADFQIASQEPTVTGEPKFGASAGVSTIYLGRERLRQYAIARLKLAALDYAIAKGAPSMNVGADAGMIQQEVQRFVDGHYLLEGGGVSNLSDWLLETPLEGGDLLSPTRLKAMIANNTRHLKALELVKHGKERVQVACQQAGDIDVALPSRQAHLLATVIADLAQKCWDCLQDSHQGLLAVRAFLEKLVALLEHLISVSEGDDSLYEEEVGKYEDWLESFQTNAIPKLQREFAFARYFKQNEVEQEANAYLRMLEKYQLAQMKQKAHWVATESLKRLLEPVKAQLASLQAAVGGVQVALEQSRVQCQAVVDYQSRFECPNGLILIKTEAQLQDYYHRILPDGGEPQVVIEVYRRAIATEESFSILSDWQRLTARLEAEIAPKLSPKLNALHVVEELHRQYPGEEALGAVLKERDRESFEFIQLKDSADLEHGVKAIRLLGIDQNRAGDLLPILRRYAHESRMNHEVVNTADPERIIFVQYRGVFSYKDWAHFDNAKEAYRRISRKTDFEKHHIVIGSRFLPFPGEMLTPEQAAVVVIKAWLLDRIETQPYLCLVAAGRNIKLDRILEVLGGGEGYKPTVEVVSAFNCHYLEVGADAIRQRLALLQAEEQDEVERAIAPFWNESVVALLNEELDWWERNTVRGAMVWGASRPVPKLRVV